MNDPHVAALFYRIEHSSTFSYENARPFNGDLTEFRIRIESDQATVEPKQHFATAEAAREVIEPFLRVWELDAALTHDHPDLLRFAYRCSKIIDWNPPPGEVGLRSADALILRLDETSRIGLKEYSSPSASPGLAINFEVEAIFDRWSRYKNGQALLGDTANFVRGALEQAASEQPHLGPAQGGRRQAAADHYRIDRKVIDKLGCLAEKGGSHSRKIGGYRRPYTENERAWLEAVLKKLLQRASRVAYDPNADHPRITMRDPDLPRL